MPRRAPNQLRDVRMTPHYIIHPEGSVLVEFGETKVLCTASVEERVPKWLSGKGSGWVTAEYDMLPRSTTTRKDRDARKGRINGRTQEISRLIGRALRAVVDLETLGENSITIDCDVLQADGGTRTASITGGYVALAHAVALLESQGRAKPGALRDHVAAISIGVIENEIQLDLDYRMDSNAQVDMNVVMTGGGELVEVQGTGEGHTFSRSQLNGMLDVAFECLPTLISVQKKAIETPLASDKVTVTP
ncbi:MAG: ribonuclease PH [Myxococcota bacterium]